MAGGLLQLVSAGLQDRYLTTNPEITFFKTAYKRYTHFGKENIVLNYDQSIDFNKKVSFTIPKNGDILSNIFLHFNFNSFFPNISNLSSQLRLLLEKNIDNLNDELKFMKVERDNIKIYCNIIFGLMKIIEKYENTLNITLQLIRNLISSYQKNIISDFNRIKNLIPINILESSNLFKLILEDNIYESIDILVKNKNLIKKYLIKKINILNNRILEKQNIIKNAEKYPVSYKWKNNLAHLLINYIELEIDGEIIDQIRREEIEIYYQHRYKTNEKNKFEKMLNGEEYNNFELYLPLNFWFNESYGLGLPLISLRNSTIKVNVELNSIENLFDLIDFDNEYNKLLTMKFEMENVDFITFAGSNLISIDGIIYDIKNMEADEKTNIVSLKRSYIYINNLINNLNIDIESANIILTNYGSLKSSVDNELSLDKNEFSNFVLNFSNLSENISNILPLQYNLNKEDLTTNYFLDSGDLYCEFIFLDEIEREKFASAESLNYLIKLHKYNSFLVTENYFNKNLNIDNYVVDFTWYLQERKELQGNKLQSPRYNNFLKNSNIESFQVKLDQYDLFHKQNSAEYFNQVIPYQKTNHSFTNNYYYHSFSLYPEQIQPTGGISFSDIQGKQFICNIKDIVVSDENPVLFNIYFRKMSVLRISKGKGKLAFYS